MSLWRFLSIPNMRYAHIWIICESHSLSPDKRTKARGTLRTHGVSTGRYLPINTTYPFRFNAFPPTMVYKVREAIGDRNRWTYWLRLIVIQTQMDWTKEENDEKHARRNTKHILTCAPNTLSPILDVRWVAFILTLELCGRAPFICIVLRNAEDVRKWVKVLEVPSSSSIRE